MGEHKFLPYEEVAIAAILHDIGKLYRRGLRQRSGKHQVFTRRFFNDFDVENRLFTEKIIEAASRHHSPRKDFHELAVKLGDHISAGMDRNEQDAEKDEEKMDTERWPLVSIFSEVDLFTVSELKKLYYLPRVSVNYDDSFIRNFNDQNEVEPFEFKQVLDEFLSEFKKFMERAPYYGSTQILHFIEEFLLRYGGFVPSAAYTSVPDISLYDHSRTTAAFATVLFKKYYALNDLEALKNMDIKTHKDDEFIFIALDISGIQNFIFQFESNQSATKLMRARSFYVVLLSHILSRYIVDELELTPYNVLVRAGGKSIIVASNDSETCDKLVQIRNNIEKWSYEQWLGTLYPRIAWVSVSPKKLIEDFKGVLENIVSELDSVDFQRFSSILSEPGNAVLEHLDYSTGACSICGVFSAVDESKGTCRVCSELIELGVELLKSKKVVIRRRSESTRNKEKKEGAIMLFDFGTKIYEVELTNSEPEKFRDDVACFSLGFSKDKVYPSILNVNYVPTYKSLIQGYVRK